MAYVYTETDRHRETRKRQADRERERGRESATCINPPTSSFFPARIQNLEIDPFIHHVTHASMTRETKNNHVFTVQTR
jgi:hypothetical protein